jgi:hypothetical protein
VNENFKATKERFKSVTDRIEKLAAKFGAALIGPSDSAVAEEKNVVGEQLRSFMEQMPVSLAPSRAQLTETVGGLSTDEWEGLRALIGLTPETRATMEQPREIRNRPVYYLSGDRLVFFDKSSVYDALFEAFDELTRSDTAFRDGKYVPRLSQWTEDEVCEHLRRIFPADSVFQSVVYPNPDEVGGETELDAAVLWGPFLLLLEVKGKQFRPRARTGDPARLRTDVKANVEDAFGQTNRAVRYIEGTAVATFREKTSDRTLEVRRDALQRIFPISVTLHHLSGLATQLAVLKKLGLFKTSTYPWSVSLADIDIITRFAGTPDVLLHYIQRRLDLQHSEKPVIADELDLFGTYLDSRLHPSEFWDSLTEDGETPTLFGITGGSERFDDWFEAEIGRKEQHPDIRLDVPPRVLGLLDALRRRTDDAARWIAFALLDLSPKAIARIDEGLEYVTRNARADSRIMRSTFTDGDLVISLMAALHLPVGELERQAVFRVNLEKYRYRTSRSLALALNVGDNTNRLQTALWVEHPWAEEEIFENFLAEEKAKAVIGERLPRRNERCFCGSGKKFKKCCLGKVRLEQTSK